MGKLHVSPALFDQLRSAEPDTVIGTGPLMLSLAPDPVQITVRKVFTSCVDAKITWMGVDLGGFIIDTDPKGSKA